MTQFNTIRTGITAIEHRFDVPATDNAVAFGNQPTFEGWDD